MHMRFLFPGVILLAAASMPTTGTMSTADQLYNPYERSKNGPPLTEVFHKAKLSWLFTKLIDPRHQGTARMPNFEFTEDEAIDILAYLKRVAGPPPEPIVAWPAWADKSFEDLDDDESEVVFDLVDRGTAVWGNARCTICHIITGSGEPIGGFVDLRVGGMSLREADKKLKRDWLYRWIKDPKDYFTDTLMPRFRFSDADIKGLIEYILRNDAFRTLTDDDDEQEGEAEPDFDPLLLDQAERVARGQRLIRTSRCVICHDLEGIPEILPPVSRQPAPEEGSFEFLAYDLRCLTCHSIDGRGGTYAPDLTGEGSRLHKDWIADFVAAPDMIRPLSQQMPKFELSKQESEIIATYMTEERLDQEIPTEIPGGSLSQDELQRGHRSFLDKGCFACHSTGDEVGGSVGPDLTVVGDRLQPGYIWYHLKHPHAVNPYSPEPTHELTDIEIREIAGYLASKKGGS